MARILLNLKREDLARLSGVSETAIGTFETGKRKLLRANHETVQRTLERMGAEFTEGNGVKMRDG